MHGAIVASAFRVDRMTSPRLRPSEAVLALWPAVVLILLGAGGFALLLESVNEGEYLSAFDQPLVEWLADNRTDTLTTVLTFVTNMFGSLVLPIIVAVIALVWWRVTKSWWHPALLVGAMLLSTGLSNLLKHLISRDRPDATLMVVPGYETTYSFPSGHTIGATTLVLVVSYLLWHDDAQASWRLSLWSAASVLIIATVAFSRMYLGFHFLTDVLAGACVAVVVLGVVVGAERWHDLALEHRDPPARSTPLARTSGDAVGTYEEDLAARWDEDDDDAPASREEDEGARSQ
ncbi:hypothetical protein Lsed01_01945 [Demequina sediminis]|uniref:Phosphatidic acid phosphatase type 2/haloperoxidase domain-containing protein n=2 Tax=Demequina sediminis TaxID=1930058 RepID=A0ABP9WL10_9MICO|nr:hypothetical protein GCM10025873_18910 [Demequina sediminis]